MFVLIVTVLVCLAALTAVFIPATRPFWRTSVTGTFKILVMVFEIFGILLGVVISFLTTGVDFRWNDKIGVYRP